MSQNFQIKIFKTGQDESGRVWVSRGKSGRVGLNRGESERLRTVGQDNRAVQNSPECLKNAK